jgi:hypothetical protein
MMRALAGHMQMRTLPVLQRLRVRTRRHVLWLRHLWSSQQALPAQGLAITDDDVDRTLADPEALCLEKQRFYQADQCVRLTQEIARWDRQAAADPRWLKITQTFDLTPEESDLLSLAVAVEADPWWRRVCGYLHDDATATHPTLWLCEQLFDWQRSVRFGPGNALVRWLLAQPVEGTPHPWSATAPWTADPAILAWLQEGTCGDPLLGSAVEWVSGAPHRGCLYPEVMAELLETVRVLCLDPTVSLELELVGPPGAGRFTLAAQCCARDAEGMLAVDAARLFSGESAWPVALGRMVRVLRLARLQQLPLCWRSAQHFDARLWQEAVQSVGGYTPRLVWLCNTTPSPAPPRRHTLRRSFRLPALERYTRCALWAELTGSLAPRAVSEALLTPGEIAAAALAAPAGAAAVRETCRILLYQAPGDLFTPLPLPYTWDDIVLPEALYTHLQEVESYARLRFTVLEEWGFARLTPHGRGLSVLFAGPSGVGKTMAAQILARSLEMDLYRVDLAGVVNKYIGETEKRLKQVFDACERSNVILFFDEADALFGQRTEVKDAHDRYANIEVNYLLQRMEQFEGIAILATNRREDIDKAFLRRLRFLVNFLPPGPPERLALWQLSLLKGTPRGVELLEDDIDWRRLAEKVDLTGAGIKSVAVHAAFLAREQGTRIGCRHILAALRRELAKQGKVLRSGELEHWT